MDRLSTFSETLVNLRGKVLDDIHNQDALHNAKKYNKMLLVYTAFNVVKALYPKTGKNVT